MPNRASVCAKNYCNRNLKVVCSLQHTRIPNPHLELSHTIAFSVHISTFVSIRVVLLLFIVPLLFVQFAFDSAKCKFRSFRVQGSLKHIETRLTINGTMS